MLIPLITTTRSLFQRSPIDSLLVFSLIVILLPGIGLAFLDLFPLRAQLDFATYYLAAQALNMGQSPYERAVLDTLAAKQGDIPHATYFYPPVFAALLRPLGYVPFPISNAFWFWLNVLWYFLGVYLLIRLLSIPKHWSIPAITLSLLHPALHHTLELGQLNTLLLVLSVGSFLLLNHHRRNQYAGALLGIAGLFKLFPFALLLPLFIRQRWQALCGVAVVTMLGVGLGIIAGGGFTITLQWVNETLPAIVGGFTSPNNQSLLAAIVRLGMPVEVEPLAILGTPSHVTLNPLIYAPIAFRYLGITICAVLGIITLVALGRQLQKAINKPDVLLEMATTLTLALLINSIVWYHYYVLLLIPIGVGLSRGWQDSTTRRLILVGVILIAIQRYWRLTVLLGSPLLISLGTIGTLAIWWALIRLLTAVKVPETQPLSEPTFPAPAP